MKKKKSPNREKSSPLSGRRKGGGGVVGDAFIRAQLTKLFGCVEHDQLEPVSASYICISVTDNWRLTPSCVPPYARLSI